MTDRNKDSYQTYIYDFLKDILVVCPQCSNSAIVKSDGFSFCDHDKDIRVICTSCGFNKKLTEKPTSVLYSASNEKTIEGRHLMIGVPIDPFFHLQLWIRENVNGNLLWAYNYEHLEFIRTFINSKLRERNGQEFSNKSLGSRLPKWMTSKSNRETVLKTIEKIRARVYI